MKKRMKKEMKILNIYIYSTCVGVKYKFAKH